MHPVIPPDVLNSAVQLVLYFFTMGAALLTLLTAART